MPQQTWLDKAERYLLSAQILLNDGDIDSCVSRAYYGARYVCLHILEREGLRVDRRWLHDTVINETISRARNKQWLRNVRMTTNQDFGASLNYLHELRNDGDYGRGEVKPRNAERAFAFATALLQAVRENLP